LASFLLFVPLLTAVLEEISFRLDVGRALQATKKDDEREAAMDGRSHAHEEEEAEEEGTIPSPLLFLSSSSSSKKKKKKECRAASEAKGILTLSLSQSVAWLHRLMQLKEKLTLFLSHDDEPHHDGRTPPQREGWGSRAVLLYAPLRRDGFFFFFFFRFASSSSWDVPGRSSDGAGGAASLYARFFSPGPSPFLLVVFAFFAPFLTRPHRYLTDPLVPSRRRLTRPYRSRGTLLGSEQRHARHRDFSRLLFRSSTWCTASHDQP